MSSVELELAAPRPSVGRQAMAGPVTAHPVVSSPTAGLSEKMQMANALAAADKNNNKWTSVLPEHYQNSPGACLMAIDYAERNELSIFEVLSEVSFNKGRRSVSARLQKKLAARSGYRVEFVAGDDTFCTVAVYGPQNTLKGEVTYTYAQAEKLGIIYKNGVSGELKSTWAGDPGQMLFHRATTRGLDRHGPSGDATLFVDEYEDRDEIASALTMLATPSVPDGEPFDTPAAEPAGKMLPPRTSGADVVDITAAEVKTEPAAAAPGATADAGEMAKALRAAAETAGQKEAGLVKWARSNGHGTVTSFDSLAANTDAANDVLDWLESL